MLDLLRASEGALSVVLVQIFGCVQSMVMVVANIPPWLPLS